MRIGNVRDRLSLMVETGAIDVEEASKERFPSDVAAVYDNWTEFRDWVSAGVQGEAKPYDPSDVGPPSPRPRQVFGVGANYADHVAEAGIEAPEKPAIFTKFPTCITGPTNDIELPSNRGDWEVELVVVLGARASHVSSDQAWDLVAGVTIGQDISERRVQFQKPIIQLALGKSFPTFGPIGPTLVTIDELEDPDDLAIACQLNGEEVQASRTSNMLFGVADLIAYLSDHVILLPGDLIFTGTPSGVGSTRNPRRYLCPGDEVVSRIEGLGQMHNRCVAGSSS